MQPDLIRVALQADEPSIRDLFERSGMVEIVESAPEVLVWHLPSDSDGLPAELRAALGDPHGPGIVALTDDHPSRWFEEAMHLGVDDVLCLPQSAQSLGHGGGQGPGLPRPPGRGDVVAQPCPAPPALGRDAHVFTVFSTKGGSGKTVISTNLAVCFGRQGLRTLLVDLDLHSGDDALVLGLSPRWTVLDLVQSPGDLDAEKLAGFVTRHSSGVDLLPAPTRPDEEELVAIDRLEPLLEVARRSYDAVVIDTSSSFSPATLLAIDHTDTLVLVGASDVPDDQEPEDRARDARPARDEPARHADPDEPLRRQGGPRGSRRRADAAPRDHLHPAVRQGDPGLGQPRPARRRRQPQVPCRPLAPGDRALAPRGRREPPVTPDRRRRTLAGRMRRAEPAEPAAVASPEQNDPFAEIRQAAQAEAVRELGHELSEGDIREEDLHEKVTKAIDVALAEAGTPLSSTDRARLVREITHNILGYGPIEPFLADPEVTEVMVNNHHTIYVERRGLIEETEVRFGSERHLLQVIDRIVAQTGRRIDESSPMVDARLPDGSRVNAIIPPLAITGPSLTIRKFSRDVEFHPHSPT